MTTCRVSKCLKRNTKYQQLWYCIDEGIRQFGVLKIFRYLLNNLTYESFFRINFLWIKLVIWNNWWGDYLVGCLVFDKKGSVHYSSNSTSACPSSFHRRFSRISSFSNCYPFVAVWLLFCELLLSWQVFHYPLVIWLSLKNIHTSELDRRSIVMYSLFRSFSTIKEFYIFSTSYSVVQKRNVFEVQKSISASFTNRFHWVNLYVGCRSLKVLSFSHCHRCRPLILDEISSVMRMRLRTKKMFLL